MALHVSPAEAPGPSDDAPPRASAELGTRWARLTLWGRRALQVVVPALAVLLVGYELRELDIHEIRRSLS